MALRIAFDLDGVLADMESALAREAVVLFGDRLTGRLQEEPTAVPPLAADIAGDELSDARAPESSDPVIATPVAQPSKLKMTAREQRRLWRHVATIDNFWETLDECEPGVVARLAAIATARRWEIIFLTKRPASAGLTAQVQTQRWLVAKGFILPSVFVVQRSRGRIAASLELDIVVDDRPDNCLDVAVDSKARPVLVWRADRTLLPAATRTLGIGAVASLGECLDILERLDTEAADAPGLVDRLMRLFGVVKKRTAKPLDLPTLDDSFPAELSD